MIFRRRPNAEHILIAENASLRGQVTSLAARLRRLEDLLREARCEIEELEAEIGVLRPVGAAPVTARPLSDAERRELNMLREQNRALEERLHALTIASAEVA